MVVFWAVLLEGLVFLISLKGATINKSLENPGLDIKNHYSQVSLKGLIKD